LATLAIVARLQPVAVRIAVHDMPERSIPAIPALRELKKVPTRMRSGAGQAGAFTAGHTTRRLRVKIVHSDALSIS
jgi:hypothetical protein